MTEQRLLVCTLCKSYTYADCAAHGEEWLTEPTTNAKQCPSGHDLALLSEGYGYCDTGAFALWRLCKDEEPYAPDWDICLLGEWRYCDCPEDGCSFPDRETQKQLMLAKWLAFEAESRVKQLEGMYELIPETGSVSQ